MRTKSKNWMPRVGTVLRFGRLNESVEKQVKPFVADKVKVLCESFMLSVITFKTLVPVYRELYRLMLMLAMQMLWTVFMMLGMTNVHWVTWKTRFLWKLHFSGKLGWRNSLIAKILPLAKLLQQHFANSQPGAKFSASSQKLSVRP